MTFKTFTPTSRSPNKLAATMVILGIDPGITHMGLGVIDWNKNSGQFLAGEMVQTEAKQPATARVALIYQAISRLIETYHPSAASIEGQYFYRQNELAFKVGWAVGAVAVALAQAGIELYAYGPMQVKKALVGTGRADKEQVAFMVGKFLGLRDLPTSDHTTDALALALTHAFQPSFAHSRLV